MTTHANQLLELQQQLIEIAIEKQQSIMNRDVERLGNLNREEVQVLKQLSVLEKQGIPNPSEDDIAESQRLHEQLQHQLAINDELLKDALQFTNQMIAQLTGDHQPTTYSKTNELKSVKSFAFDSKA